MMVKKLVLVMACFLILVCAAACAPAQPESSLPGNESDQTPASGTGKVELVFAWWGNQTRNERTQAVLDLYSEKNPDVTFDAQFAEWDDYWNKLATASAAHNLPDIIQMDYRYIRQYVSNNLLADLTEYVKSGVLDLSNVEKGIIDSGSINNRIYAVCNGVNAPALIYNKTLLDKNGIKIKDNMTMDEFFEVSREVYNKTGYKTNLCYGSGEIFIEYYMRGLGFQLFKEDGLGVNSPEDLEKFFALYELGMKEGWHVHPSVFAERIIGSVEQATLVYGTSPDTMSWNMFQWSNMLTAYQNAAPEGVELGITTWPSTDPKASNYLKPSQFFSVTVDSKNVEACAKVIDFITNSVECNEILLGERGVPASSVIAEAIAPLLDSTNKKVISFINDVVTPNCSTINPPAPDGASEIFTIIDELEERLCYGQINAKEAAEELYERGNAILKSKSQ